MGTTEGLTVIERKATATRGSRAKKPGWIVLASDRNPNHRQQVQGTRLRPGDAPGLSLGR